MRRLLVLVVLVCAVAHGDEVLRAYDVADLLTPVRDFPAPELGVLVDLPTSPDAIAPRGRIAFVEALATWFDAPTVAALIERTARPPQETSLAWFVRASPAMHTAIDRRLRELRHERAQQVTTSIAEFRLPLARRLAAYGLSGCAWRAAGADGRAAIARLPAAEATALRAALQADRAVASVASPRVSAFSGQTANVSVVREVPVRDVVVDAQARLALAPRLMRVGDTWTIHARVLLDGAATALRVERSACRVADGEPPVDDAPVRVVRDGFVVDARLDAGETLVVAPPPAAGDAGIATLVLIDTETIDPDVAGAAH